MLKFQIALVAILIACVTFVSCSRQQQELDPVLHDMMDTDDTMAAADMLVDLTAHKSWANVGLPGPIGSGTAHGMAARTIYVNDIGVMANKEGTMYPAGTVIVKEIMDDTNTSVMKVATMMKTADPMYADHNGWMYAKFQRMSVDGEYALVGGGSLEGSTGCHGCHAEAHNDSVFISLSLGAVMADDMADHDMADDMMADDMMDDGMADDMMADDMADHGMADDMMDDGMADDMMADDMADHGMADDMADDAGDGNGAAAQ